MINISEIEINNSTSSKKDLSFIQTYTHLKEIYCDYQKNRDEIEPIYENMRIKYKSLYKSEPEFFTRIPYAITLFGDEVTKLYDDKIVTTIEKDLIICANKNKDEAKMTFVTHDV